MNGGTLFPVDFGYDTGGVLAAIAYQGGLSQTGMLTPKYTADIAMEQRRRQQEGLFGNNKQRNPSPYQRYGAGGSLF